MDYFKLAYTAAGGLGVFFLGMKFLSEGLQSIAGDFIRKLISYATANRFLAIIMGLLITTIVQSSSVTTVMVVGLVNAGLMGVVQSIGVVLGANIGTTITGWILAVKVGKYGLLLIGIGIFPMLFSKNDYIAAVGKGVLALGMIFLGLELMSGAFKPLRTDADFLSLLHYFDAQNLISVLGCVGVGCLLTMIIQSSSAMLGITIALASTGTITFHTALALVMGENIGTTITAQLAAIGGTSAAKRTAISHAIFNVLGVAILISCFEPFVQFVDTLLTGDPDLIGPDGSKPLIAAHIALGHSLFNVTAVIVMLPFIQYLAKLVEWLVPESKQSQKYRLRYINSPGTISAGVALQMASLELQNLGRIVQKTLMRTKRYVLSMDDRFLEGVRHLEDVTDNIQMEITTFVCKVMEGKMSTAHSERAYALIRGADELESIADYCLSLCEYRKRMNNKKLHFSDEAWNDLNGYFDKVRKLYQKINSTFLDKQFSGEYESITESILHLNEEANQVKENHLARLKLGTCLTLPALIYSDMVVALRRIKNHSDNLAQVLSAHKLHAAHQELQTAS